MNLIYLIFSSGGQDDNQKGIPIGAEKLQKAARGAEFSRLRWRAKTRRDRDYKLRMNLIYLIFSGGGQYDDQKATNKVRQKASKSLLRGKFIFWGGG